GEIYRYFKGNLSEVYDFSVSLGDDISSLTVYDGEMYVGFRDTGRVYRSTNGTTWTLSFFSSSYPEVNSITAFDDKVIFGVYSTLTSSTELIQRTNSGSNLLDSGSPSSVLTQIDCIMSYSGRLHLGGVGTRVLSRVFNPYTWDDNVASGSPAQ